MKRKQLLTAREIELMRILVQGKKYKEAASLMVPPIGERTIKGYAVIIMKKLGCASMIEAAVKCVALGIIDTEQEVILTVKEAAHMLHLHENTIRRWANDELLPVARIGNRGDRRFKLFDINKLLEKYDL